MPVLHDNSRDECIVALLLRSIEPNPGTAANKIENTAISIILPPFRTAAASRAGDTFVGEFVGIQRLAYNYKRNMD